MANIKNKTRVCEICGIEKSFTEYYKRKQYYKHNVRPQLRYYKECKVCFGKIKKNWSDKNKDMQKIYYRNFTLKKAGRLDEIDISKYRGRMCERPNRIENHLKREKNKKLIKEFQSNARSLKKERKKQIDDKYQEIIDDLSS